jgi:hypothetical protein
MLTGKQIKKAVKETLERLIKEDEYLFTIDANERALTHRMAIYLEEKIRLIEADWNVDCEYNRDVTSQKEPYSKKLELTDLPLPDYTNGPYEDENATTVFPDVIVHKRGKNGANEGNLLVIEVKKSTSTVSEKFDKEKKLPAYLKHFYYKYACFVMLNTKTDIGYQYEFIA